MQMLSLVCVFVCRPPRLCPGRSVENLELALRRPPGLPLVLNMFFKVATLVCLLANSMTCDKVGDDVGGEDDDDAGGEDDDDDEGYRWPGCVELPPCLASSHPASIDRVVAGYK